jgi:hypothetical protein
MLSLLRKLFGEKKQDILAMPPEPVVGDTKIRRREYGDGRVTYTPMAFCQRSFMHPPGWYELYKNGNGRVSTISDQWGGDFSIKSATDLAECREFVCKYIKQQEASTIVSESAFYGQFIEPRVINK